MVVTHVSGVACSRGTVHGILLGTVFGLGAGPLAGVVIAIVAALGGSADAGFWLFGIFPAVIVGGVVGAAAGGVAAASAVGAGIVARRMPNRSAHASRTASALGAAGGAAAVVAAGGTLGAMVLLPRGPGLVGVAIVAAVAVGAAAAAAWAAWTDIEEIVRYAPRSRRDLRGWRFLAAGFSTGVVALLVSLALLVDSQSRLSGDDGLPGIAVLLVLAPTAAALLATGVWLSAVRSSVSVVAAATLAVVLLAVTGLGVASVTP